MAIIKQTRIILLSQTRLVPFLYKDGGTTASLHQHIKFSRHFHEFLLISHALCIPLLQTPVEYSNIPARLWITSCDCSSNMLCIVSALLISYKQSRNPRSSYDIVVNCTNCPSFLLAWLSSFFIQWSSLYSCKSPGLASLVSPPINRMKRDF